MADAIAGEQERAKYKFYLAGKWADRVELNERIHELEQDGYVNTHNWTQCETPEDNEHKQKTKRIAKHPGHCADWDVHAVRDCDFMVAVMDDAKYAYRGTFTEIGVALGLRKPLCIVCPFDLMKRKEYCLTNPFFYHPTAKHFASWKEFREWLAIGKLDGNTNVIDTTHVGLIF